MLVTEIQRIVLCLWQVLLLSHNFLSFNQQAFTYLCHIRKATGLKGIMRIAVQEARTE